MSLSASHPDSPVAPRLAAIRADLIEARRYVASYPETAAKLLGLASHSLTHESLWRVRDDVKRIRANLIVGKGCLSAAPDVTAAAITLAVWELGGMVSDLRREMGRSARDAELTEAYGPREGNAR